MATPAENKQIVLEAFDTLFNRRDYAAAARFWSPHYIQHSAHIEPGRDGLFNLVKSLPDTLRYENALVTNDVETLVAMFWTGAEVMRFGVTENLYGPEELEAFRKARPAANLTRTITRMGIVSFGRDFASITLEFERASTNGTIRGRQSQVWARMSEGWRIVQAHVSLLPQT